MTSVFSACRAPLPTREAERLASACGVCDPDVPHDVLLDCLAHAAAARLACPMGVVTIVLRDVQTFLGRSGLDLEGTSRDGSFCAHTIAGDETLIVEDAREDPRFWNLEIVRGAPHVRFYAGAPIRDREGLPLGSVCALGTRPRYPSSEEIAGLEEIAIRVGVILETRLLVRELLGSGAPLELRERTHARLESILSGLDA